MTDTGEHNKEYGAERFGFRDLAGVHWNLGAPQLYEFALQNKEAKVAAHGPIVAARRTSSSSATRTPIPSSGGTTTGR